jgi:lipase chaperone LimK
VTPEALRARVAAEITRRLPAGATAEATAVLDRYLAYRERVRDLADQDDEGDLDARLAMLVAIRREVLGPETAEAFFAEEEAEARTLLATRRIAADPSLTPEERTRRTEAAWAALEADLPPEVREARAAGRLAETLRRAEDEIHASGGGNAEVQALRERLAGPEAAARLADLDGRRAAWTGRVEAFRAARARLAEDASLAPAERDAAVDRLLTESFTPAERMRVQALDRIAATP